MTAVVYVVTPVRQVAGRPVVFHVHGVTVRRRRVRVVDSFVAWTFPQAHHHATSHGWTAATVDVERLAARRRLPPPVRWLAPEPYEAWIETWTAPRSGRCGHTLYVCSPDRETVDAVSVATAAEAQELARELGVVVRPTTVSTSMWPDPTPARASS